jgi:hypothetical protein
MIVLGTHNVDDDVENLYIGSKTMDTRLMKRVALVKVISYTLSFVDCTIIMLNITFENDN